MKEYRPVETEEYAMAQEIDHELTFNWWVNSVLSKRLRMISLVNKRNAWYLKNTHKFRIEVPKSVAHIYALDKKNANTLWAYDIAKEMKYLSPAFKKLDIG